MSSYNPNQNIVYSPRCHGFGEIPLPVGRRLSLRWTWLCEEGWGLSWDTEERWRDRLRGRGVKRRGQAPTAAPEHGAHVRLWLYRLDRREIGDTYTRPPLVTRFLELEPLIFSMLGGGGKGGAKWDMIAQFNAETVFPGSVGTRLNMQTQMWHTDRRGAWVVSNLHHDANARRAGKRLCQRGRERGGHCVNDCAYAWCGRV